MALALLAAGTLAACDTTFQQNARAELAAKRSLAGREPQAVTERTGDVRVRGLKLLTGKKSTAVVAELQNVSGKPLADLAITVGVRKGSKKVVLNEGTDLGWFQTHVPVIPAGETVTWVFQSPPGRQAPDGYAPFVRVGAAGALAGDPSVGIPPVQAKVDQAAVAPLPQFVEEEYDPKAAPKPGFVRVVVTNPKDGGVPQLDLPVQVVARDGSRITGAGTKLLEKLQPGRSLTVDVPVTGRDEHTGATSYVYPTIFQ